MPIEIERKFLPRDDTWRAHVQRSEPMAQGYLTPADAVQGGRASVRIRLSGEGAWLNIKSRDAGPMRQEHEYAIPLGDARALMALCVGGRIEKVRHHVNHAGHAWEVDEFLGDNAGLVVAELEFESVDTAFDPPPWLGPEVTALPRYYTRALSAHPYSQWSGAERAADDATEA